MTPRLSICMSAYEVEDVLQPTLESILGQTYTDFELVILDNGSTDGTGAIIRALDDPRVRALSVTPNIGGYEGMNHAIAHARGELVAVYHSDDLYHPDIVRREVEFLSTHPEAGAVFAMDRYIDDDGIVFGATELPAEFHDGQLLDFEELFRYTLRKKNTLLRCPTFMTRAGVLREVGAFAPDAWGIASDLELWLRLSSRHPIGILADQLLSYRVRSDNWSARYERLRTEEERHFAVMDHYLALDAADGRVATAADLREHEFHRCDDETQRAANHVLLGDLHAARRLLARHYAWSTFLRGFRLRKARVAFLRATMRAALAARQPRLLAQLLSMPGLRGRIA